jgi:hypothetical protein
VRKAFPIQAWRNRKCRRPVELWLLSLLVRRFTLKTEDFLLRESMLEIFSGSRARHPLRDLREQANLSQMELSKATGLSCSRISLAENGLGPLTAAEEKKLKGAIVSLTNERRRAGLSEVRK